MINIDNFKYIWDGTEPSWGLLAFNGENDNLIYQVINFDTRVCLLIEDRIKKEAIIEKIKSTGGRVMTMDEFKSLPPLIY